MGNEDSDDIEVMRSNRIVLCGVDSQLTKFTIHSSVFIGQNCDISIISE